MYNCFKKIKPFLREKRFIFFLKNLGFFKKKNVLNLFLRPPKLPINILEMDFIKKDIWGKVKKSSYFLFSYIYTCVGTKVPDLKKLEHSLKFLQNSELSKPYWPKICVRFGSDIKDCEGKIKVKVCITFIL